MLALRPKYQLAVWNLFSDPGEKVVLGAAGDCIGKSCGREEAKPEDKWLFYRQDVEFLVQPSPLDVRSAKLDNPVKAIERFRDQLKAKGVELLVVITPGKPSIYPERLTGNADAAGNAADRANSIGLQSHGRKILDSLTRAGFNTVDLYTPLLAAKSRDSEKGPLYLNDDTHWTPRGAEIAADVIAKKVREMVDAGTVKFRGKDTVRYVASDSLADRMGDVGEMSGLNKFGVFKVQKVTGHVVMQQNIKIRDEELPEDTVCIDSAYKECMNRKKADRKDGETMDVFCLLTSQTACALKAIKYDTTITPFKDDFRKSEILILGDSFSRIYQTDSPVNAGWIAHFAKNMNRPVASIVSDGGASVIRWL